MIGMILVTHGRLADHFIDAMEHVVGKQEGVATICIGPNDDMEQRRADIADAIRTVDQGQGAIIDLGADPDAVMRPRAFQMVALGEQGGRIAGGSRVAAHVLFRNALREAGSYGDGARIPAGGARADLRTGDDLPIDPRLAGRETERAGDALLTRFDAAALVPVVRGEQPLYVYVERASDIRAALALTSLPRPVKRAC